MKNWTKTQSGSRPHAAFGVMGAVLLGLTGAYFGAANKAPEPKPTAELPPAKPAPRAQPDDRTAALAPVSPPATSSDPSAPVTVAFDEASPAPPATLPAPPELPAQPSKVPSEAEQDPAWKASKTQAMRLVVASRAERLQGDVAERQRGGDTAGAERLRVLAARLQQQLQAMDGELSELSVAERL